MYSVAFARGLAPDRLRKTGTLLLSVLAASLLLCQPGARSERAPGGGAIHPDYAGAEQIGHPFWPH